MYTVDAPKFDLAIVLGRFGHGTLGHQSLFDWGLTLSRRLYVIVGSAQERDTLRNPFPVEIRIQVIEEMYPGISKERLIVGGLNDMTNELDVNEDWGRYVKSHVEHKMHKFANVMLYGNDEFRSKWFAPEDLTGSAEFVVPRSTIPISATQVRGYLLTNNEKDWQKCTSPMIHYMYQQLREVLMSSHVYKEIYDQVRRYKVMDLDVFMKVYSKYEAADRAAKLAEIK